MEHHFESQSHYPGNSFVYNGLAVPHYVAWCASLCSIGSLALCLQWFTSAGWYKNKKIYTHTQGLLKLNLMIPIPTNNYLRFSFGRLNVFLAYNNEETQWGKFFHLLGRLPIQIFVIKYWGLPIDNPQYPNIL